MSWDAYQEQRLRTLWATGVSVIGIAQALNISRDMVNAKARRMGLSRSARFADALAETGSIERAAKRTGIGVDAARKLLDRMVRRMGWQAG